MSTVIPNRPPVKKRDILKYTFASVLAIVTFAAIAGMTYAKAQKRQRTTEESRRIQQTLEQFGTGGQLPGKMKPENPQAPASQ